MKKRMLLLITALMLATGLLAAAHISTRASAAPGTLLVTRDEETMSVALDSLELSRVEGSIVNGRGEERRIEADGVLLRDVIEAAGMKAERGVAVVAADEYAAEITAAELAEDGRVWLIRSEDSCQLIVFGDPNSRRAVKNVERLEVE